MQLTSPKNAAFLRSLTPEKKGPENVHNLILPGQAGFGICRKTFFVFRATYCVNFTQETILQN